MLNGLFNFRPLAPLLAFAAIAPVAARTLRVCADPSNLPFSNDRREGFDNRIAELVARDLGAEIEYTWWAARRPFIREALYGRNCDVVIGVPAGLPRVLTTRPYYRSTYVFIYRKDSGLRVHSLEDPILAKLRIGAQMLGEDFVPPAQVLAANGVGIGRFIGYTLFYEKVGESPGENIVNGVAKREVDIGLAWGPFAGYFARGRDLEIVPVPPSKTAPAIPFAFDMCLGVRLGEQELRDKLDGALDRNRNAIRAILREFGVPGNTEDAP